MLVFGVLRSAAPVDHRRDRRPRRRCSSACSCSRSVCRSAARPATRSTRRVTSDRGSCTRSCRSQAREASDWAYSWVPVLGPLIGGAIGRALVHACLRQAPSEATAMKKLINHPEDVVAEELQGIEAAHGDRVRVTFDPAVHRPQPTRRSRARSGWSPAAARGTSRCTAGSSGRACSTPPARARSSPRRRPTRCWRRRRPSTAAPASLHIVKNYTGDVMNFEMAAELGEARGHRGRAVVIDDDVAVEDRLYTAGRRGVGATVLVEKICGGAADDGRNLPRSPSSAGGSTPRRARWAWR